LDKIILELKNVHRLYGDYEALRGISLEVRNGQIFGYLGPNWVRENNNH